MSLRLYIPIFYLSLISCNSSFVGSGTQEIPDQIWSSENQVEINIDCQDTTSRNDFYIIIRHTNDYTYSNLYLFLQTSFPNGKTSIDTINCPMADATGRWYGGGIGGLFDNQIMYQKGKKLPLPGNYTFKIKHAMRDDNLEGISDVGVLIENPY